MKNQKLKFHILVLFALVALLLPGCSSTPAKVSSGRIKASTFNFVNGGVQGQPAANDEESLHVLIQQALTTGLAAKGLTKVAAEGDVTVAYLVIAGNNVSTTSLNKYFGYGRDSSALLDKAHSAYTSDKDPNYFEAGTLVVDIIDSKTHELLWRQHVTRPILRNPSAELQASRLQEAVNSVLESLRVTP